METRQTRPTILMVEDIESNYLLVSYILRDTYDLLWAHDGVEALELFRTRHVDLILMDFRMPRMGGIDTTVQIRRTDTNTPIIALTAFAFDNNRQEALRAGCTDFMAKPIDGALLKNKIEALLSASDKTSKSTQKRDNG